MVSVSAAKELFCRGNGTHYFFSVDAIDVQTQSASPKLPLHHSETPSASQIVLTGARFPVTPVIVIEYLNTDSQQYISHQYSIQPINTPIGLLYEWRNTINHVTRNVSYNIFVTLRMSRFFLSYFQIMTGWKIENFIDN